MIRKRPPFLVVLLGVLLFVLGQIAAAQSAPLLIDDSQMQAVSTTVGGASPLPTARTVAHWFGTTFNPLDGVTYGHNMVGADPNNCSGSDCDVTITVDITPLIVTVAGLSFIGSAALPATLASPIFATYDFGSVPFARRPARSRHVSP